VLPPLRPLSAYEPWLSLARNRVNLPAFRMPSFFADKNPTVLAIKVRRQILLLLSLIWFGPRAASQSNLADQEEHIRRIETNAVCLSLGANEPSLRLSLQKLMELYKIPGFSIAVIDNYKIAWATAFGVIEVGSKTPVITNTLFQVRPSAKLWQQQALSYWSNKENCHSTRTST